MSTPLRWKSPTSSGATERCRSSSAVAGSSTPTATQRRASVASEPIIVGDDASRRVAKSSISPVDGFQPSNCPVSGRLGTEAVVDPRAHRHRWDVCGPPCLCVVRIPNAVVEPDDDLRRQKPLLLHARTTPVVTWRARRTLTVAVSIPSSFEIAGQSLDAVSSSRPTGIGWGNRASPIVRAFSRTVAQRDATDGGATSASRPIRSAIGSASSDSAIMATVSTIS